MNLPEFPEDLVKTWNEKTQKWEPTSAIKYGAACYAKGRADLLAEIGEPVAYLNHKAGMPPSLDSAATAGTLFSEPLYVLPKEQK